MANHNDYIWQRLVSGIGNEFGAAGMMGNLEAESALNPMNLERKYEISLGYTDETYTAGVDNGTYSEHSFVNDSAGYGLAQWTYWSRKQALYNMYKAGGYTSIGSIELAMDYLIHELKTDFPSVLAALKSATSVRQASDVVLHDFESPADQSEAVEETRAAMSQKWYNEYAGGGGSVTPTPTPDTVAGKKMGLLLMYLATRRRA